MPKLSVVISQGQSANPVKRKLEEDLVGQLLFLPGVEVTVVPHLYDLSADGTGVLCLQGISGDVVVLSWLFPRAARWTLHRHGIRGRDGIVLLVDESEADDDDADEGDGEASGHEDDAALAANDAAAATPNRRIYCIDLRARDTAGPFVEEIRRIAAESSVQTVQLGGGLAPLPSPSPASAALPIVNLSPPKSNGHAPAAAPAASSAAPAATHVAEEPARRWYPVIDYGRCTNCMECIDFCLFGVYGVDAAQLILVEQPDNCRKGCPACSRVCPENAIIFPQHKTPAIAGSATGEAGGLKIDLSRLFGAPDALEQAVLERDTELVAAGRDAVGFEQGIAKRQSDKPTGPKDKLDRLLDQLDELEL